jgi:hypothetical protein
MLLRLRWFLLGLVSAIGGGAYVMAKLVRMRARFSRENVMRASALAASDALAGAARIVAPGKDTGVRG